MTKPLPSETCDFIPDETGVLLWWSKVWVGSVRWRAQSLSLSAHIGIARPAFPRPCSELEKSPDTISTSTKRHAPPSERLSPRCTRPGEDVRRRRDERRLRRERRGRREWRRACLRVCCVCCVCLCLGRHAGRPCTCAACAACAFASCACAACAFACPCTCTCAASCACACPCTCCVRVCVDTCCVLGSPQLLATPGHHQCVYL